MKLLHKTYFRLTVLFLLLVLSITSCGGGGSSSSDGTKSGATVETVQDNGFKILPLSSLPPLKERLYGGVAYGKPVSGPAVGQGLFTSEQLVQTLMVEEQHSTEGIVVEAAYMINSFDMTRETNLYPLMKFVGVVTNVSNAMYCSFEFKAVNLVTKDGKSYEESINIFRGFNTVEYGDSTDDYEETCLPPGKSAYIHAAMQFETTTRGGPSQAQDFEKVIFSDISAYLNADYVVDDDGLFTTSYKSTGRGSGYDFFLSVTNQSTRTLRHIQFADQNIVFYIDPTTGIPLGFDAFSGLAVDIDTYPETNDDVNALLAPGDVFSDSIYVNTSTFLGSTTMILATYDWIDENRR